MSTSRGRACGKGGAGSVLPAERWRRVAGARCGWMRDENFGAVRAMAW
eukprot:CAMPEP_0184712276 /NCGR_PEP_ID=MMETSP0314-20130426/2854_1 /TAXON_ID=38298 /ORGANISM="Rhodella maculata, Strain CCMP 736" /LENGTH=47 /DNA_ID= /DNA_START= /DNA_END= /DNA_ORIENTATION=